MSLILNNLNELTNIFTKEAYPPNEKNISEVPFKDIQNALFTNFGSSGFSQKVTHVGQLAGENYVVVEVTLPLSNGNQITICGASQGKIGIAGLITGAVRNAILRHAGMGAELYEHEEGQEPQFQQSSGAPPNPFANSKQQPFKGNQGNWQWDGQKVIGSGKHIGKKWADLPESTVAFMASQGNETAVRELNRRSQ